MKERLCLLFCDYFQEEVEWLLKSKHYADVTAKFYRADCDKTKQSAEVLELIASQASGGSVIVFSGFCLNSALENLADRKSVV